MLLCVVNRFHELAVPWSHDFPSIEVVGKPMAVRAFHFSNVRICFNVACTIGETVDETRWNVIKHEARSHFQGIWYALGIWVSLDDWLHSCWLYQRLCAWCLSNWWPSNLHFFAKQCGHAASCPLHSDTPAEHSALSAFPASPALPSFCPVISIIKPGRCCMTSSSGPRSAMPQRMNLNEIAQEATVSCTIGCFMPQKQSRKWG